MGIHIAALFNPKAKKWVQGRKDLLDKMAAVIPAHEKTIWMHCASLGEFEQGRPVVERIRNLYPGYKLLITFFSPSGFEVQKNYKGADWIFYLPLDGSITSKRFIEIVHPSLVIFVKYEFWYYYLKKIKYRNIPLLLISAVFRKDMSFFKWYGSLQRKMLSRFDHIFVQTLTSKHLIGKFGLDPICTLSGDTRFDRVIAVASQANALPVIERFAGQHPTLIAGSTWPEDEEALQGAFALVNDPSLKIIIAPHEIDEKHISAIQKLFPGSALFSVFSNENFAGPSSNVLIIDNIGMLSRLYQYARITYIGGALKHVGIHNTLEAAAYNKPVLFGPNYEKYSEAVGLVRCGGGLSFSNTGQLAELIQGLLVNGEDCMARGIAAGDFVRASAGATEIIIRFIQEKRLLTN